MATDLIIRQHHHHLHITPDDDDHTSEDDTTCNICLDDFDSRHNPPTVTICKHEFHLQCILEWFRRSKECPLCWQLIMNDQVLKVKVLQTWHKHAYNSNPKCMELIDMDEHVIKFKCLWKVLRSVVLVHGYVCLESVVVTPTLDRNLHAFDALSQFNGNNEVSTGPMLNKQDQGDANTASIPKVRMPLWLM